MSDNTTTNLLALENDFLRKQNGFYKKVMIELLDYISNESDMKDLIVYLFNIGYPITQLVYDINLDEDIVLEVAKANGYIK